MNEDRFEAEHGVMLKALKEARGECPPADRLLDWVAGTLDGEDAQSIEVHVALCSRCDEAAARAGAGEPEVDELNWRRAARRLDQRKAPWQPARPRVQPVWFAAAAAAVALFAILVVYWPEPAMTPPPVSTVRDAGIDLIEPVGPVPELAAFRWRGLPAPVRYRVEVAEAGDNSEGSEPFWARVTPETRLLLDQDLAARLAPGRAYRWRVVVLDEEGQALARSDWVEFELEG